MYLQGSVGVRKDYEAKNMCNVMVTIWAMFHKPRNQEQRGTTSSQKDARENILKGAKKTISG
jgi:hypothetical protein